MDASEAIKYIDEIFEDLSNKKIVHSSIESGKVFELLTLFKTISYLKEIGFAVAFVDKNNSGKIKFKSAPGKIKETDPHFKITHKSVDRDLYIFVDIEFTAISGTNILEMYTSNKKCKLELKDNISYYEIDIIVVDSKEPRPTPDSIWLAIECKSSPVFKKSFIKEILGIRREISFHQNKERPSRITRHVRENNVLVSEFPASEIWLSSPSDKSILYQNGPDYFGIQIKHFEP